MKIDNLMQKILVVGDVSANIQELTEALKSPNYEIIVATSGKTALETATSEKPDLILLETVMAGMDGYAVCTKLKAEAATIPVIFIAQPGNEQDEIKGLELGALDYIIKPIRAPLIKAKVKNYLALIKQTNALNPPASTDCLTGTSNRRRFEEILEQDWRRAIRGISQLSLIMIDIDYFRLFNEHYGYETGDDCLKQIARALENTIGRSTDLIARYEGDKFACLLPLTDAKGALVMANKFRNRILSLNIPHAYSAIADHITISQGIATVLPYPNSAPTMLIMDAENALFDAKASGRNQMKVLE